MDRALRVLAVDDYCDTVESTAALLQCWGHECFVAHDGPGALAEADSLRPDVILLDLGLPKMSGYEVARRLRVDPQFEGLLLIAVTGYGQAKDQQTSKAAGFDFHLIKPVDMEFLRELLDGWRKRKAASNGCCANGAAVGSEARIGSS